MLLAAGGWPTWQQFIWITIAMASARTLAMGSNRIADRWIDSRNPRTANRPLVTGSISLRTAWIGTLISAAILAISAFQLSPLTVRLLPGPTLFLIGYSFTKRFTWMSHFIRDSRTAGACRRLGRDPQLVIHLEDLPAWILRVSSRFGSAV
jgi:4-hydroxybenzoate polyprenyltransferase